MRYRSAFRVFGESNQAIILFVVTGIPMAETLEEKVVRWSMDLDDVDFLSLFD